MICDHLAASDDPIITVIAEDAVDGISLKISKNGGVTRGQRHRDICIAAGLVVPHGVVYEAIASRHWMRLKR